MLRVEIFYFSGWSFVLIGHGILSPSFSIVHDVTLRSVIPLVVGSQSYISRLWRFLEIHVHPDGSQPEEDFCFIVIWLPVCLAKTAPLNLTLKDQHPVWHSSHFFLTCQVV